MQFPKRFQAFANSRTKAQPPMLLFLPIKLHLKVDIWFDSPRKWRKGLLGFPRHGHRKSYDRRSTSGNPRADGLLWQSKGSLQTACQRVQLKSLCVRAFNIAPFEGIPTAIKEPARFGKLSGLLHKSKSRRSGHKLYEGIRD